ncbi:hypothetical protein [Nocardiopsis nanhaiensis]
MYTRTQLQRGFIAHDHTREGVPTTVRIFYLHDAGGSVYTEYIDGTYHYSDAYGEHEPDETLTAVQDVCYREMMKTIAIATNQFGYQPYD